jgi:iron complex outermembrane receptor protein
VSAVSTRSRFGAQPLEDNPFRTASNPYVYVMAIVGRQIGPFELIANFENVLTVRQTHTAPLVRQTRGMGGRRTTDVGAPLEGFMAHVALRYRWKCRTHPQQRPSWPLPPAHDTLPYE